jgi:hypothetical protein
MTPEELEAHEASIPEWKRNAMVVTDQQVVDEPTTGIMGKIKGKIN